ncbi:heat shock protein 83-like [Dorcoceras hygrometricum]|uniref:Heat shock protein 83-like n=1 Tax=Dorcoceras hygrometricum TaxID=472368 RepID=A0A2Z7ALE0_9LAMI|nr:heat shock protein 83-like [Dorcoceras hygrometricum]
MGGAGGAAIAIGVNVRDRFQGVKSRTPNWNWKRSAEELIHRYSGRKAAKPYESDASLKWGTLPVDEHIEEDLLLLLLLIMSYTTKEECRIPHLLGRKEDVPGPTHRPAQIQQFNRKAVVNTSNNRGMGDRAGVERRGGNRCKERKIQSGMGDRAGVERRGGNRCKERKIQSHQEYLVRKVVIELSWGGPIVTKDGEQLGKETKITLFVKEGKTTEKEFSDEENDESEKEQEGGTKEVDEEKEKDKGEKKKSKEVAHEWQLINKQKPIWRRKPEEITKDEYAACYKSPTSNWEYRLTVEHFSVEDQMEFKAIYYITGESKVGENYPSLERLKKKGYEITYMVGAIDEYTVGQLKEDEGKKLVSATKERLKLDEVNFDMLASHWKEKPLEEDTWEDVVDFQAQCPYTSLGDKADLREEDIVRRINRPRPKVTYIIGGPRPKIKSGHSISKQEAGEGS